VSILETVDFSHATGQFVPLAHIDHSFNENESPVERLVLTIVSAEVIFT